MCIHRPTRMTLPVFFSFYDVSEFASSLVCFYTYSHASKCIHCVWHLQTQPSMLISFNCFLDFFLLFIKLILYMCQVIVSLHKHCVNMLKPTVIKFTTSKSHVGGILLTKHFKKDRPLGKRLWEVLEMC